MGAPKIDTQIGSPRLALRWETKDWLPEGSASDCLLDVIWSAPSGSHLGVPHLRTNLELPIWEPILGDLICEKTWEAPFGVLNMGANLGQPIW